VLVTGGAGFIGSNFVLQWLKHESSGVVNLDKGTRTTSQVCDRILGMYSCKGILAMLNYCAGYLPSINRRRSLISLPSRMLTDQF
jgi:FlaA1/EpsC-like NDP-sugar epimerase